MGVFEKRVRKKMFGP